VLLGAIKTANAEIRCAAPPWPPTFKPIVTLEPGDIRALAEVIYGEGRGESWCGQVAIGWVVVNRIKANPKTWGATVDQVVTKPNQFSSFGKTDPNLKRMKRADESEHAFFMANAAALSVLSGAPDPTGGATYFHHRNMVPDWAPRTVVTQRIGDHVFRKGK
jgi:spore germination cell wall hydrolase CwlJ-like protein